ncbi:MAG TPA: type II toxin-antitoxin system Phd/YefM family antitoxin [Terriglobales bacterium]|nr:type II toxin-antitoxin system Phd/YefM family antitoxin [Terriglobales bacterium]
MPSRDNLPRGSRQRRVPVNTRVEARKRSSFTATEAKNEFGQLLEQVIQGQTIVITKHQAPKAVLISIDEYNELKRAPESKLNQLTAEFDLMIERMQMPKSRRAMKAAFEADAEQMGKAALSLARKRG